jgi:glycosyltransferase involved in cell wall biosynthesis
MSKQHLLLIANNFNNGGAEQQLLLLAQGLRRRGWKLSIAVFSDRGPLQGCYTEFGATITSMLAGTKNRTGSVLAAHRMACWAREEGVSLVQTWLWRPNVFGMLLKGFNPRIRIVAGKRGLWTDIRGAQLLFERLAYHVVDAVSVNSCVLRDAVVGKLGIAHSKVHVIPNAIVVPETDDPSIGKQPAHTLKVGMVGRFLPTKRQEDLIEAVALLRDQGVEVELTLVGEGHMRSQCEALAKARGLPSCRFITHIDGVMAWMAGQDVIVLSSIAEGMPNVVMEAMAVGKPVVAVRGSGADDLILDGASGYLVAPCKPEDIASRLARIAESPELRRNFGAKAREHIRKFDVDSMVNSYEGLYQELLARN